jgi:hypothetical protein
MSNGFATIYHNYSHSPDKFSQSEDLVRRALEALGYKKNVDWTHEFAIKGKVGRGERWHYWLDFFMPEHMLDIEVDPKFHSTFTPYLIRCRIRTKRLKRVHIRTKRIQVPMTSKGVPLVSLEEMIIHLRMILPVPIAIKV